MLVRYKKGGYGNMIKPLNDYVLLQQTKSEEKVGSIILADTKNKSNVATIIAVGPGKKDEDGKLEIIKLKPGERVIYREYATTTYEEHNTKYLLIKVEDIIAIVE